MPPHSTMGCLQTPSPSDWLLILIVVPRSQIHHLQTASLPIRLDCHDVLLLLCPCFGGSFFAEGDPRAVLILSPSNPCRSCRTRRQQTHHAKHIAKCSARRNPRSYAPSPDPLLTPQVLFAHKTSPCPKIRGRAR